MDTCICMAESLHCSPEIVTTLFIVYPAIQNKKFKETVLESVPMAHYREIGLLMLPTFWEPYCLGKGERRIWLFIWKVKDSPVSWAPASHIQKLSNPWVVGIQLAPEASWASRAEWEGDHGQTCPESHDTSDSWALTLWIASLWLQALKLAFSLPQSPPASHPLASSCPPSPWPLS